MKIVYNYANDARAHERQDHFSHSQAFCGRELTGRGVSGTLMKIIPYPTAFPYGNGMVLHFYQQQESSMTKTVHKVINKGLKAYV